MTRRNKTCIDPLSAFGLVAGAFVAGIVTERATKVTHRAEKEAQTQKTKLQDAVRTSLVKAQDRINQINDQMLQEMANAREAIQGKTEPAWSDWEEDEFEPTVAYSARIIRGIPYLVSAIEQKIAGNSFTAFTATYQKKATDTTMTQVPGGPIYGAWETEKGAKNAAEKHAGIEKKPKQARKNGRTPRGLETKDEVLEAFFQHSRITPKAIKAGIVGLRFIHYPDEHSYRSGKNHQDLKTDASWEKVRPGEIVEVLIHNQEDPKAPLAEKDRLVVQIEGKGKTSESPKANPRTAKGGPSARTDMLKRLATALRKAPGGPYSPQKHVIEALVYKDEEDYEENGENQNAMGDFTPWEDLTPKLAPGRVVDLFIYTRIKTRNEDDEPRGDLVNNVIVQV